jgi:hypothetical protein
MNKDHSSIRHWICFACSQAGPRPSFNDEGEFTIHIKQKHQPGIRSSQIPVLVSAWSRSIPTHIEACPLCPFQDENSAHLLDHIAQEVHAFSLRSLPWGPRSLLLNSSEIEVDSEDDGNYKAHFKGNQYFGDGSESTQSQNTAAASLRSSGEEGLPPLDYRREDALSTGQSSHSKLTEDAMTSVQSIASGLERKLVLDNWISETIFLAEEGTDSNIGSNHDLDQSKKPLKEAIGPQSQDVILEVNVRDEGFTVLSGGMEPAAESVIPHQTCVEIANSHLIALYSSTEFRATQRKHGHTARKNRSPMNPRAGLGNCSLERGPRAWLATKRRIFSGRRTFLPKISQMLEC